MKIPKLILEGLAVMSILIISGCATAPITTHRSYTLNITSNPGNAKVYINDNYVGRTPCYGVPLNISYDMHDSFFEPFYVERVLKEQYILRVSMEGYKDATEQIDFIERSSWDPTPIPLKTDYYFALEREE